MPLHDISLDCISLAKCLKCHLGPSYLKKECTPVAVMSDYLLGCNVGEVAA